MCGIGKLSRAQKKAGGAKGKVKRHFVMIFASDVALYKRKQ